MSSTVFPPDAGFPQPEPSPQPATLSTDDIPIDPALSEPPLDPALLVESAVQQSAQVVALPAPFQPYPTPPPRQYSQGPQGDPFAPQPPPVYLPVEEPVPIPTKPVKRKRQPRREEECGFCEGNDSRNKYQQPETMVSCADCGRSAHPTCLDLTDIGDVMRSYAWSCHNCKKCEVCHKKEGDNRMIFCDGCDRGWHMDCLQPPLEETPPGRWLCPLCLENPPPDMPSPSQSHAESHYPTKLSPTAGVAPPQDYPTKGLPENYHAPSVATEVRIHDGAPASDESEAEAATISTATRPKSRRKSRAKGKEPVNDDEPTLSARPKRMRLRLPSPGTRVLPASPSPKSVPTIRLRLPARDKGKAREEEPSEPVRGMFDDLLSAEDRDVRETTITNGDKQRFERSRIAAEEKLAPRPRPAPPDIPESEGAGPSTRPLRSSSHHPPVPAVPRSESPVTPGPQIQLPLKGPRIRRIRFGEYDIETWYDAPFPEEYSNIPDGRLWLCEFCLKYMKSRFVSGRHQLKCKMRHPPGDEIYRDGSVSIFEVDGRKNKIYCQNLCLLSKMFLDHKSLFYDVEPFLFYVIAEFDDVGARFVGYFSKEKRSPKDYNVSCIMTLPVRQRQGWGQLLIDFSYLLSKKEQRAGSPEKPLSPLGVLGYKSYWTFALMRYFQTAPPEPSLEDISAATAMTIEDIYNTLVQLKMIKVDDGASRPRPLPGQAIKLSKNRKNGVARKHLQRAQTHDDERVKGPFVAPTKYEINWSADDVEAYMTKWEAKNYLLLKPEKLKWSPFVVARTRKTEQLPSADAENGQQRLPSKTSEATPASGTSATPIPGAVAETRASSAMPTKSPAFSLFDDDNVITVSSSREQSSRLQPEPQVESAPASAVTQRTSVSLDAMSVLEPTEQPARFASPGPIVESPPAQASSPGDGPDSKFDAMSQEERDRAFAEKLARDLSAESGRRLRSRGGSEAKSPVDMRTPARTRDEAPFSRKTRPPSRRWSSARGMTSTVPMNPPDTASNAPNGADSVAEDAALAARLAREQGPRRLRSQSNVTLDHEAKRAVPSQRSVSPRKRRRIDSSSPEADRAPATPPAGSPRKSVRRRDSGKPISRPGGMQRRSSRMTNETARALATPPPEPSSVPVTTDEPSTSGQNGTQSAGILADVEMPDAAVDDQGGEDSPGTDARAEMKYEDVGTPLTAMTSRHSVPSDDTIVATEDNVAGATKASPVADVPAMLASEERNTQRADVNRSIPMEIDGIGDADAEGEEDADADAEGEPDAEAFLGPIRVIVPVL